MDITRRHTLAVTGATLALVVAGSAVVVAGGRDDRGRGFDRSERGVMREHGRGFGGFGGFGRMGAGPGFGLDGLVRSETTVDLGEAGFLTRRIDDGTVTSASETELTYTLATGESATVSADEDTQVLTVVQADSASDEGRLRRRMVSLDEIALAEVPAEADVIVWSEAGASGQFVAQRVLVRPAVDDAAAADDAAAVDAAPSDGAASDGAASDGATSGTAPEASPAI